MSIRDRIQRWRNARQEAAEERVKLKAFPVGSLVLVVDRATLEQVGGCACRGELVGRYGVVESSVSGANDYHVRIDCDTEGLHDGSRYLCPRSIRRVSERGAT